MNNINVSWFVYLKHVYLLKQDQLSYSVSSNY